MKRHSEKYLLDIITGKQKGSFAGLIRIILWIFSWPFRLIVTCRNWAFDHGWLRRYSPPVPVVMSIGNIVVGGTGKTPATLLIAREFYQEFLIAILSRGYRSQAEKLDIPIVLSRGEGPMQSASFCGDEPYLLAQNLPKAYVIVGKNRHKASDIAAKAGVQLILLDDGMQHRRLARDFEVVLIDTSDPFGQGYFLPRGLLREGITSLSRAHLIILNHATDDKSFEEIKGQLMKYSKAPVIGTVMQVESIQDFDGIPILSISGKKVGLFCGIAHPEYFYNTVREEGAEIVDSAIMGDHLAFSEETLSLFAENCKALGAEMLLCTEKDKVKFVDKPKLALPIVWVKMHLQVAHGNEEWQNFLHRVRNQLLYK